MKSSMNTTVAVSEFHRLDRWVMLAASCWTLLAFFVLTPGFVKIFVTIFYHTGKLILKMSDWWWLTDWLTDLVDWLASLIDLLTAWLVDWQIDWRRDRLTEWMTDCLVDWLIYGLIEWLADTTPSGLRIRKDYMLIAHVALSCAVLTTTNAWYAAMRLPMLIQDTFELVDWLIDFRQL